MDGADANERYESNIVEKSQRICFSLLEFIVKLNL